MKTFRPVPRLSVAIQRLGIPAASAAFVIWTRRNNGEFKSELAVELIRVAILQRHMRLAVHPAAQRDPSQYRKGFGRFPKAA